MNRILLLLYMSFCFPPLPWDKRAAFALPGGAIRCIHSVLYRGVMCCMPTIVATTTN